MINQLGIIRTRWDYELGTYLVISKCSEVCMKIILNVFCIMAWLKTTLSNQFHSILVLYAEMAMHIDWAMNVQDLPLVGSRHPIAANFKCMCNKTNIALARCIFCASCSETLAFKRIEEFMKILAYKTICLCFDMGNI